MLPTRTEAERLLKEAEACNPGPWGNHSRVCAHCAEKIAQCCKDMDPEKAYVMGLLHDIGRKFGVRHLGHVSDGYTYMMSLGYDEAARICLTHWLDSDKELIELINCRLTVSGAIKSPSDTQLCMSKSDGDFLLLISI